jgi:hypothetical protein
VTRQTPCFHPSKTPYCKITPSLPLYTALSPLPYSILTAPPRMAKAVLPGREMLSARYGSGSYVAVCVHADDGGKG